MQCKQGRSKKVNPLNTVMIEGNTTRDAELKYANSGTAICKLSVAVNRFYKSGEGFEKEVSFFDVDTFGEVAKICAEKCHKGDAVRITGRLKQNRWTTTDGTSRSQVVVIADHVEIRPKAQGKEEQPSSPLNDKDIPF
jgi:single-strand DNA-binding protein